MGSVGLLQHKLKRPTTAMMPARVMEVFTEMAVLAVAFHWAKPHFAYLVELPQSPKTKRQQVCVANYATNALVGKWKTFDTSKIAFVGLGSRMVCVEEKALVVVDYKARKRDPVVRRIHDAHATPIQSIDVNVKQCLVVTGAVDVKVWDWSNDWQCVLCCEAHHKSIHTVKWNPLTETQFVSSCPRDHSVRFWDTTQPGAWSEKPINQELFKFVVEDAKSVEFHFIKPIVFVSTTKGFDIWDYDERLQLAQVDLQMSTLHFFLLKRNPGWLVVVNTRGILCLDADADQPQPVERLEINPQHALVTAIAGYVTKSKHLLVIACANGFVMLDLAAKTGLHEREPQSTVPLPNEVESAHLTLTRMISFRLQQETVRSVKWCERRAATVFVVTAAGPNVSVTLWEYQAGRFTKFPVKEEAVAGIAIVEQKNWCILGSTGGTFTVVDMVSKKVVRQEKCGNYTIKCVEAHPSLPLLLTSGGDYQTIKLWDWEHDWSSYEFRSEYGGIPSIIRWAPAEPCAFASGWDRGEVCVWICPESFATSGVTGVALGQAKRTVLKVPYDKGDVHSLSLYAGLNDQMRTWLASCAERETIRIWDYKTETLVHSIDTGCPIYNMEFCPLSDVIFTTSYRGGLYAWHVMSKKLVGGWNVGMNKTNRIYLSKNGSRLAIRSKRGVTAFDLVIPWELSLTVGIEEPKEAISQRNSKLSPKSKTASGVKVSSPSTRLSHVVKAKEIVAQVSTTWASAGGVDESGAKLSLLAKAKRVLQDAAPGVVCGATDSTSDHGYKLSPVARAKQVLDSVTSKMVCCAGDSSGPKHHAVELSPSSKAWSTATPRVVRHATRKNDEGEASVDETSLSPLARAKRAVEDAASHWVCGSAVDVDTDEENGSPLAKIKKVLDDAAPSLVCGAASDGSGSRAAKAKQVPANATSSMACGAAHQDEPTDGTTNLSAMKTAGRALAKISTSFRARDRMREHRGVDFIDVVQTQEHDEKSLVSSEELTPALASSSTLSEVQLPIGNTDDVTSCVPVDPPCSLEEAEEATTEQESLSSPPLTIQWQHRFACLFGQPVKVLAFHPSQPLITFECESKLMVINYATNAVLATWQEIDSALPLSGIGFLYQASVVFARGRDLFEFKYEKQARVPLAMEAHKDIIQSLQVNASRSLVVTGCSDVKVWSFANGWQCVLCGDYAKNQRICTIQVKWSLFGPASAQFASYCSDEDLVRFWDVDKQKPATGKDVKKELFALEIAADVLALEFHEAKPVVFVLTAECYEEWNYEQRSRTRQMWVEGTAGSMLLLRMSRPLLLVLSEFDGLQCYECETSWDAVSLDINMSCHRVLGGCVSGGKHLVALACMSGFHLVDLEATARTLSDDSGPSTIETSVLPEVILPNAVDNSTLQLVRSKSYLSVEVCHLQFDPAPSSQLFVSTCRFGGIWDYRTGQMVKIVKILDWSSLSAARFIEHMHWFIAATGRHLAVVDYTFDLHVKTIQDAHKKAICDIEVHPALPLVLTCDNKVIKLWDWESDWQAVTYVVQSGQPQTVRWAAHNTDLFAAGYNDKRIRLWNRSSVSTKGVVSVRKSFTKRKANECIELKSRSKAVSCLSFYDGDETKRQGWLVAAGSASRIFEIWDTKTRQVIQTITLDVWNVKSIAFHPKLPLVLVVNDKKELCAWNTQTFHPVGAWQTRTGDAVCVCVPRLGDHLVIGSTDHITFFTLEDAAQASNLKTDQSLGQHVASLDLSEKTNEAGEPSDTSAAKADESRRAKPSPMRLFSRRLSNNPCDEDVEDVSCSKVDVEDAEMGPEVKKVPLINLKDSFTNNSPVHDPSVVASPDSDPALDNPPNVVDPAAINQEPEPVSQQQVEM